MAEVNDKGDVTVEGEFVGRLEGFRFSPDKSAQGAEAKALKTASMLALAPQFHLRADRFYNAPDTEIDFTEQGGLMWGEHAVGKLTAGADALNPTITVFVDDSAGTDVAQKVERRLQHFISRKVTALFEPLIALQNDEALTGLARGFAFRMVESLGILPRADVAQEVKDLDQDSRGALRKHGIRFGQFTIFLPLLLKPAPTRLRLVLWSLVQGLQEFPEAPPPGLVTVPADAQAPKGYDTMCGYRSAGTRAIRIDMLERLADMLRGEDSRGGFEAKPDMLSITGMTLEQFTDLMSGLGYKAEKGERAKVKASVAPEPAVAKASGSDEAVAEAAVDPAATEETAATAEALAEATASTEASAEAVEVATEATASTEATEVDTVVAEPAVQDAAESVADVSAETAPEVEPFVTFTWGRNNQGGGQRGQRRGQNADADGGAGRGGKPQSKGRGGKPQGKSGPGKGAPGKGASDKKGGRPQQGAKTFSSRPPKPEKRIDPDNPFAAALMGMKQGK